MDQSDSLIKIDNSQYVHSENTKKILISITVIVEVLTIVAKVVTFGLLSLLSILFLAGRGAMFVIGGVYFAKSKYKTRTGYILFAMSCLTSLLYAILWMDSGDNGNMGGILNLGDSSLQIILSLILMGASLAFSLALYIYAKKQKFLAETPRDLRPKKYFLILSVTLCAVIIMLTMNLICFIKIAPTGIGVFPILIHPVLFVISGINFAKSQNKTKLCYILFALMCITGVAYVAFYPSIPYYIPDGTLSSSAMISSVLFLVSLVMAVFLLFCVKCQTSKSPKTMTMMDW